MIDDVNMNLITMNKHTVYYDDCHKKSYFKFHHERQEKKSKRSGIEPWTVGVQGGRLTTLTTMRLHSPGLELPTSAIDTVCRRPAGRPMLTSELTWLVLNENIVDYKVIPTT